MSPSRPRVEGEREDEILDATLAELLDVGYDRLTMDAVARRSRAGKATLYRRWETKAALVVDAVARAKGDTALDTIDTGTLRGDLLATYCGAHGPGQEGARVMGAVVTGMATDPEFAALFRERFVAPKLAQSRAIYERAAARGEIGEDADLEVIAPAVVAVLMHRTFLLGAETGPDVVERVVDHLVLPALRTPTSHR